MESICEALVAAFLVDLFECSGLLDSREAAKVHQKIYEGKDVVSYDYDYQEKPVA